MHKLRMQRKGAHRVVRIGIPPAARHGGVVDGKQLDYALARLHGPVHQLFKVVEFSHAKTVFRTEGEHGNGHAGAPPGLPGEGGLDIGHHHLRFLRRHLGKEMVGAFFPAADLLGLGIYDDEFVLDGLVNVHGNEPPGSNVVRHNVDAVPVAQLVSAAHDGQGLVGAHFGSGRLDAHVAAGAFLGMGMAERGTAGTAENDVAEGR